MDFSKAFDVINRHILFYKIISSNVRGKVIDTVRSLYSKTKCRIKTTAGYSPIIEDTQGVNQGGNLSPTLFREYLKDMSDYLSNKNSLIFGEDVVAHLLWADDLVLFSDSPEGLQKQLLGLEKFCSKNHMIVNESKTNIMTFGRCKNHILTLHGKNLEVTKK